ncbi:mannose-6-phosphate isomerase, class I [candidate division KSB1 bacterium]|nr:mannose-6-phosphate isomerase, class I [candidate division KSB1 bacterium]RQW07788.1 MAG: mannose-6-phosphate isomerase, class I [candidate division KSB1 bacterium]
MEQGKVYPLRGVVQHYAWGGYDYIPDLLGLRNDHKMPFAELWLGAHGQAPSRLIQDGDTFLNSFIRKHAVKALGPKVIGRFGTSLPYLLKVLDAREMLSIQVHPSKREAEEGFARETAAGVAADAPNRCYKDDNHKLEVHVALTDFWMLHGFRTEKEIERILKATPEFRQLLSEFYANGLAGLYRYIMRLPQDRVDAMLNPLVARLTVEKPSDKDQSDYWALKAAATFSLPGGHRDRGLYSIYLLNLLHLNPGESTFQNVGLPHAYLFGTTMELMANSDNVLRGGLTTKYIHVDELLKTIIFDSGSPKISTGEAVSYAERVYRTAAQDFELSKLTLYAGETFTNANAEGPEILLLLNGKASVDCNEAKQIFDRGEAFFSPATTDYHITALNDAILFRAKTPL